MVWLFVILYVSVVCFTPGEASNCTYNRCTPTCLVPNPKNCPRDSNPCKCPTGTIVSEKGGECVEYDQCQKYTSCNGDNNARFTDCPIACPSTCIIPNARYCNTQCGKPGCECNWGYLLSSLNGKCIKPENCPGGNVCRKNEVFVGCVVECPDLYCPTNEFRVACGIARPCLSGCACKSKYIRKSTSDRRCIPETECPPGKCSGSNEEWNNDLYSCFSDSCNDRNKTLGPDDCPIALTRCVCKKGFYRNDSYVCVPAEQCPSGSQ